MNNISILRNEFIDQGIEKIVRFNEPLFKYTSLEIGGPADIFCVPGSIEELIKIISILQAFKIPFWVIGKGTNLLILDKGVRGAVVKLGKDFKKINFFDNIVKVGAGVSLLFLNKITLNRGLSGLEFTCNIPGTVGGALINNASFNGECMADIVKDVNCLTVEKKIVNIPKSDLNFEYRKCNLKEKSIIILDINLQLKVGDKEKIKSKIKEYIKIREIRQPNDKLSAGSIFKNPPGYFAGELIEKVKAKGLSRGEAIVSNKHANFIINNGHSRAKDIIDLMEEVEKRVRDTFKIELEREVQILGEP